MKSYKVLEDVTIDEIDHKVGDIIELDEEVGEEYTTDGTLELVAEETVTPPTPPTDEAKTDEQADSSEVKTPESK